MGGVDYGILGSLEASRDGRQLPLGGAKQRAVLAILLLGANRVRHRRRADRGPLARDPPGKPQTAIQGYVSQLRKTLDPDQPVRGHPHRALRLSASARARRLDLFRLEALLRLGRDSLDAGQAEDAARTFRDALALFRGPPLADFGYESWAQNEIGRLEELRLDLSRGADRGRPAPRQARGARRRARVPRRRVPAPRAPARTPDARALSRWAAERGARRLPGGASCPRRGVRHRADAGPPGARAQDPAPGPVARSRGERPARRRSRRLRGRFWSSRGRSSPSTASSSWRSRWPARTSPTS